MNALAGIAAAAALFAVYGLLALGRGRGPRCACGVSGACGMGGPCERTEDPEEQHHA